MTDRRTRRTERWRGVIGVALVALTAGLLLNLPNVVLLSVGGVVFAAYPALTREPDPALSLERRLDDERPGQGDPVEVTVELANEGDATLFDCRVVDGVPETLRVTDGAPRHAGILRPGDSLTFSYTVRAERGKHPFDPATVVVRDPAGAREVEQSVASETEIDCTVADAAAPLRDQTLADVGRVTADDGGSGVEFHRTREYQRGDAPSRVDWKRFARTGSLSTVEFRRERAASVVLLVDAREPAYRGRAGEPHAVAYSVSGARQIAASLVGSRNRVGVAALGRSFAWLEPGAGRSHVDDVEALLARHETLSPTPPDGDCSLDDQVDRLRERLDDRSQVVLFSPLTDDAICETARSLEARGHAVTVVSPTVTDRDGPERRLAVAERRHRLSDLRNAGIRVVEWSPERPLAAALAATSEGVVA
ncbi:DUF58 domain-containing protein [Halosimplex sp. TS25]|uniref:DUF58 domain-containing protein n=1 Tax=Halosimplex rarum TaxID=3396619 RepID=UPI0039E91F5D